MAMLHRLLGIVTVTVLCGFLYACGNDTMSLQGAPSDEAIPIVNSSSQDTVFVPTERGAAIITKDAGDDDGAKRVVVKFKDGTQAAARDERLGRLGILEGQPGVLRGPPVSRVASAPEEEVTRAREQYARRGIKLHDWNQYYFINTANIAEAARVAAELAKEPQVEYAEVLPKVHLLSVQTAPLTAEQKYLDSASTGGLGVRDAWDKIIDQPSPQYVPLYGSGTPVFGGLGSGVQVVDQETNWNFDHEALPIDETEEYLLKPELGAWALYGESEGKTFEGAQHGTAVVGILAGQGSKGHGLINGAAPDAATRVASISDYGLLVSGVHVPYGNGQWAPGQVLLIETGQPGITTTDTSCSGLYPNGCVPLEATKYYHDAISDTVASGAIIVGGAGNSFVDLDDDEVAPPLLGTYSHFNLPENDSGSILVGASTGPSRHKAPWSNCGSRVDVYGWGHGVVTSGYGDYGMRIRIEAKAVDGTAYVCLDTTSPIPGYDAAKEMITNLDAFGTYLATNYPDFNDNPTKVEYVGVCENGEYTYDNDPSTPEFDVSDQNKWYTSRFGGTSAATAQVAGVAALVQSYFRQLVAASGYDSRVVYLDGWQMREILKASGTPAVYGAEAGDPNPNCNVGVQPDAKTALDMVDTYITEHEFKYVPLQAESLVVGNKFDMDGDGRADLISWSMDGKWYVDLSSVGAGGDNFGEWDLIFPSPLVGEGQGEGYSSLTFPVVHDYNSDGLADIAIYDSRSGKYYIKYTSRRSLVAGLQPEDIITWDRVIDYSADPNWRDYSRPYPADYDGDTWVDIGFQGPDGYWMIDYGGIDSVTYSPLPSMGEGQGEGLQAHFHDSFGTIDKTIKYLTDAQLAEAPGWAWQGVTGIDSALAIAYKTPDGVTNEKWVQFFFPGDPSVVGNMKKYKDDFGGNDYVMVPVATWSVGSDELTFKHSDGTWTQTTGTNGWFYDPVITLPSNFGSVLCHPIPADYDGDNKEDFAVQCGNGWRIVYSSSPTEVREIYLDSALNPLPAKVYSGGIKYQDIVANYSFYSHQINCPVHEICDIFDAPPPIGPRFVECVEYWAPNAAYCWNK